MAFSKENFVAVTLAIDYSLKICNTRLTINIWKTPKPTKTMFSMMLKSSFKYEVLTKPIGINIMKLSY